MVKVTQAEFNTLTEALKEIHGTSVKVVVPALKKYHDFEHGITDLSKDELVAITVEINNWIDTSQKPNKGNDNYKVARCLVWLIAKHKLKIPDIQPATFPYCEC